MIIAVFVLKNFLNFWICDVICFFVKIIFIIWSFIYYIFVMCIKHKINKCSTRILRLNRISIIDCKSQEFRKCRSETSIDTCRLCNFVSIDSLLIWYCHQILRGTLLSSPSSSQSFRLAIFTLAFLSVHRLCWLSILLHHLPSFSKRLLKEI